MSSEVAVYPALTRRNFKLEKMNNKRMMFLHCYIEICENTVIYFNLNLLTFLQLSLKCVLCVISRGQLECRAKDFYLLVMKRECSVLIWLHINQLSNLNLEVHHAQKPRKVHGTISLKNLMQV